MRMLAKECVDNVRSNSFMHVENYNAIVGGVVGVVIIVGVGILCWRGAGTGGEGWWNCRCSSNIRSFAATVVCMSISSVMEFPL